MKQNTLSWRQFRPGWKMSLLVGVLVPVCVVLGGWQLQRANYKAELEAAWLEGMGALPRSEAQLLGDETGAAQAASPAKYAFLRVRLQGSFASKRHFLIDNRTHEGAAGYQVATPFVTDTGRRFIVNRGWIAAGATRAQLPEITTPDGRVVIVGAIWPDMGRLPVFGADEWEAGWPVRVQALDLARVDALVGLDLPAEIRLERGQPGAFATQVSPVQTGAERHTGYAVQWFAVAFMLSAAFIVFGLRSPALAPDAARR